MNISYLIARLRESGVKLYHVEGQLKVVAPKGRLDPELVHELKEHKQAVIHYLERSPGVVPYETITPIPRREHYDLSSGQRRLWILHQFKAERTSYNMPAAFSLEGDPDTQALKKAINALVRRYEILRTAFSTIEGEPKQFVHDTLEVPVRHSNPSPEDLETFIKKSAERVFDLDVAPLFRVELVTVSPGKHIFLFNMHHIISDGWSLPVFFRELGILYNAVTGEETPGVDEPGPDRHLPPLRIQYRDFAHWQNTYLTTASAERSQIYWHEKMSGQIPLLDLPSDHPRPPFKTAVGRTVSFQLDNALALGIHGCCNRREITPFMFLLAAVNLVIHRYTGQGDIITGSPIAGRNHLELEDQVGLYVNTLPLRNRVRGNDTVETFLQNVKQTATEAYENQNFPFDKLVDQLDLERHTNRNPLFDVMMTLQNNEPFVLELDGIKTTRLKTENTISRFDMTIDFYEEADNILMDIEYSAGLFEEDRILRFGNHFIQLVKSITTDTGQEVRHIDILSAEEKQQLLMEFNDTQVDFPEDKTIVTLFEDQVERTPDYTAVKSVSITYRHLNHQASRLAGLLKEKGVGPDTVVAVMMERSLEMIISLFGILKAGGAYLPIDPDYPEERIRYMLKDSNAILCISDNPGKGKNNDQLSMINYQLLMKSPALSEASEVKSESTDLAYILYTSGSTGRPKGVMLEHRSLVNRIHWMNKRYPINRGDVILQKTTYTFDVSVWELFWWSFYGASVYLLPPGDEKDPRRIIDAVCNHNITIMHFVPSMLSVFLESLQSPGDRLKCSSLKRVFASGEALTGKHAEDFAKTLGAANQTTLHNLYGPTEAAIDVTYFDCDRPVKGGAIPIGKPIANTRLYILDRHRALLPVGVAGEIVISGIGLARGYLNNPLLTNEKFEVRSSKFEVFYHTGDLGRWSADGNIEFLGRIDHQVKVRGYRIELEEIRHHLVSHSLIREAEVIVRSGQNELIAFVTGKLDWIADLPGMISGHLGKFLPAYMIPSLVVPLDRFPLTANGKVDRKALNVLSKDGSQIAASAEYAPPRNETEQKLVEIWESILQRKNIGIRDNFFNIGGHSLRATLAVSRIYKEFNVEFQLNQMFDTPTIEQIASSIETRHRGNHPHPGQGRQYEPVPPMEEREYYPLSHAQKRLWLINRFGIENNIAYNMPAAHYFNGPLDIDVFKQAFRAMIQRHQILRTGFIETRGKTWQKVFETVDFNLEILTLPSGTTGAEPEKRIETITRQHSETPFDLSQFPLFSAKLLEISPHRHLFLFNAHHIINDGWSINIFNRELTQLYNAYNRDPRCPSDSVLPKPGIQYKDYAHWQNNYLQTRFMKDQEQYWLGKLSGHRPHLDFPTDFNRPTVKNYNGISIFHTLDRPLTDGIKRLCNSSGVTLFMILVAFTKILLYRYTGQEDIIVGSPIAGRNHPDLEDQLGFYVNTLALRDRVAGDHTFESVLRQVKQTTVEAYENQDYPFDKLVDQLNPDRDRSRHPLFEIMVVLQNTGKLDLTFDQLQVTAAEIYFDISKFDLTFNFDENERTGETRMVMDYNTGLFNQDRIHRLCRHFTRMVQSILQNPGTAVREVEILTGKEKNQLLEEFNGPDSPVPNEATITSLFEEQVNRTPESVAVVGMDPASGHGFSSSLTYKELGQTANRLAFQLKEYGVGPGTIVAIMVERSIRMVIGIMAILKAGGAYLPIEPDYPEDRVGYMLKDSNARVLLKSRRDQIRNPKFETNPNDQNTNDPNKNQCFQCVVLNFEHLDFESCFTLRNFDIRASDFKSPDL
ncbi:MAG: amino acid adenylation domain-containing protein, partial [bacterium]|nr:amino acid adenylation domain-containing protein [bacterium]